MKRRLLVLAIAAIAATAALAACGKADTPAATPTPSGAKFPVTVGSLTLNAQPVKIVSLSPTATEMLFAINAGGQVVAADEYSNFPANAPKTKLSGFTPNAEAIAAYNPDLVVMSGDTKGIVAQLTTLKIPVYIAPAAATLDDVYKQIGELGTLTGHDGDAAALNERMKDDVAKLLKDLPKREKPLTYFYELDPALYTVSSKTFVGSLFTAAGLTNVADAADTAGTGYPQITPEALIKSNPDMIFLADTIMGENAAKVKARAGYASVTAVAKGQIVELDTDIASRWGPRVVDLLRAIIDNVTKAQ